MDICIHVVAILFTAWILSCNANTPPPRRGGTSEGGGEIWGYTTPREGVNLFWWLYKTTHQRGVQQSPLIIWIQGGPGLSGTELGNFLEIGPLDENLNPRPTTWLREASLLFVDSPVGTGYSYYDHENRIPDNIHDIAEDLIPVLYDVVEEVPAFMDVPVYIFGQSYGGKMVPALAKRILPEIGSVRLPRFDLRGIALGNGYTSPVHTIQNMAPYLYETSLIDETMLEQLSTLSDRLPQLIEENRLREAREIEDEIMSTIFSSIPGLNPYDSSKFYADEYVAEPSNSTINLLYKRLKLTGVSSSVTTRYLLGDYPQDLSDLMNTTVREKLGIIPPHVEQDALSSAVFGKNYDSFLPSAVPIVEDLLAAGVHVVVYQGQHDVVCNTPGAAAWIRSLDWEHLSDYLATRRLALMSPFPRRLEMFAKDYRHLHMYWVLDAGHAVPADAPGAALRMVQRILQTTPVI